MQSLLEIRTLILTVTVILLCRAAIMVYVWRIAKQYTPVRFWAIGSPMMAVGAMLVGLRDIVPLSVSVLLGHFFLILGWLAIDGGIVIAARRTPPWRLGVLIFLAAMAGAYWLLLVTPDFVLRTAVVSLPGILFDIYAALACLRARVGRRTTTLRILAALLLLLAASNSLKTWFILRNSIQIMFSPDWQIGQFYLLSVASTVVGTALFVLLAVQRLQEHLDAELAERRQAEIELKDALMQAERFRLALDNVPACVYMKDLESRYTYANRPTLRLFGCTHEELVGSSDARFFPSDTVKLLRDIDLRVFAGENTEEEVDIPDAPGGRRVFLEVKTPVYDDREQSHVSGLCGISKDITTIKEYQKQLEFVAHYDPLTNLPNRILLTDRLDLAVAQCRRRGQSVAVVFLDLDGFKSVNDENGHGVGDELLVVLAKRMTEVLRQGDTLARLGGDEFVAVLVDLEQPEDCDPVLDRLLKAASDPVAIGELTLKVSASIGVTLYPENDSDADLLLRHADQAMYQAKNAGKNCYRKYLPKFQATS